MISDLRLLVKGRGTKPKEMRAGTYKAHPGKSERRKAKKDGAKRSWVHPTTNTRGNRPSSQGKLKQDRVQISKLPASEAAWLRAGPHASARRKEMRSGSLKFPKFTRSPQLRTNQSLRLTSDMTLEGLQE